MSWETKGRNSLELTTFLNVLNHRQTALKITYGSPFFTKLIGPHVSSGILLLLKRAAKVYYFISNLLS